MNRNRHTAFAFASAAFMASGCASTGAGSTAQVTGPVADLALRMDGGGGWDMRCEGETRRGDAKVHERGRRSDRTGVIAIEDVVTMRCDYEAGDSALRLTLDDTGMACPFGTFSLGVCRASLAAGQTGSLVFAPSG
jgi:hypothetical protein